MTAQAFVKLRIYGVAGCATHPLTMTRTCARLPYRMEVEFNDNSLERLLFDASHRVRLPDEVVVCDQEAMARLPDKVAVHKAEWYFIEDVFLGSELDPAGLDRVRMSRVEAIKEVEAFAFIALGQRALLDKEFDKAIFLLTF